MKQLNIQLSGKTFYNIALHLIIVVLSVELWVMARQNAELKGAHDLFATGRLKEGDQFSVDSLIAVTTGTINPVEDNRRQIVFVFSTRCRFCKENLRSWQELSAAANERSLGVYAVSVDSTSSTQDYVVKNKIVDYPVFVPLDIPRFARKNRLSNVPMTIIRSPSGNVERFWSGTIGEKEMSEIIRQIS